MRKKIKAKLTDEEIRIITIALNEKRSRQLKENRPIEPVNDLIIKLAKKRYIL